MTLRRALRRRPAAQSLVAAVPALLVAAVLAVRVPGPTLLWDGQGYLGAARWLARDRWPLLGDLDFYHPAYGAVLAPSIWVGASPMGLFRWAQAVNVLSVGATAVAVGYLARSMLGLTGWRAVVATAFAVASPALLVQASFEWPEAPFTALFAAAAVCAWRGRFVLLALSGVGLYALHPRALGIVGVTLLVVLLGRAVAAGAVLVAGTGCVQLLNRAAQDALYDPGRRSATAAVDRLWDVGEWPELALRVAGHSWYLVVTTVGLAGVAVWALAAAVRRGTRAERRFAVWLLGAVVAVLLASALQLRDAGRVDHLVYGRYVETVIPVLLVVAAGVVLRRRHAAPLTVTGAVAVALAFITVAGNGSDRFEGNVAWLNVAVLHPLGGIEPAVVTAVAVAVGCFVGLVAWRAPAGALALVAVLAVGAAVEVHTVKLKPISDGANETYVMGDDVFRFADDGRVAYDMGAYDVLASNRYQWQHPGLELRYWRRGDPPAATVLARKASSPVDGARIVATEPYRDLALWVVPGPRHDALAARGWLVALPGQPIDPSFYDAVIEPAGRGKVRLTHAGRGAPWVPIGMLPGDVGLVQLRVDGKPLPLPRIVHPGESVVVAVPAGTRYVELDHARHRLFARTALGSCGVTCR